MPVVSSIVLYHSILTLTLSSRVGDQTHVMSYPIKGGEDWNLVITVPEQKDPCEWGDWSRQSLTIMRSYYEGWDPT